MAARGMGGGGTAAAAAEGGDDTGEAAVAPGIAATARSAVAPRA